MSPTRLQTLLPLSSLLGGQDRHFAYASGKYSGDPVNVVLCCAMHRKSCWLGVMGRLCGDQRLSRGQDKYT